MNQDDLTCLKHVGIARMKRLNDSGFTTIKQLHEIPLAKLAEVKSIGEHYAKLIKISIDAYCREKHVNLPGETVSANIIETDKIDRDLQKKIKRLYKRLNRVMYYWTAENLLPDNIKYLRSLPRKIDLTIGNIRVGVFHGTSHDEDETLFPSAAESRFRELAKDSPYQVHILGHSHTPYYKRIDGVHFINPGSVGRMFDGDPRAAYAILKVFSGELAVDFFRIPYPVDAVVASLKKNRLPDIYANMYRLGRKLN